MVEGASVKCDIQLDYDLRDEESCLHLRPACTTVVADNCSIALISHVRWYWQFECTNDNS
jgi:hypothetical protein